MNEIRMVDLKGQYNKIKSEIDQAIMSVIDNTEFINGSKVKDFQKNLEQYLGVKHVIPCANGTDALQIALMALGLKAGDEVITSNFTFIATLEVIALLGLKPVIVDVEPGTYNISIEGIKKAVTSHTKAIIPVHLFGQCSDMEAIMEIAKKNKLFVVEDTAQALGSTYFFSNGTKQQAGTIGDIGCTSFFPSKNLGCFGDGGALYTNDDSLAQIIRSVANHGMKVRYYHDNIGVNSRLDTIQAAILNIKLQHLDQYNQARQKAAAFYDEAFKNLSGIQIPIRSANSSHIFHQYTLVLKNVDREGLKNYLQSKGIPAMIYYPVPLHLQNAYRNLGYKEGDFPVTEHLCKNVISLPMHTELDSEQLTYITTAVKEFINHGK
jgi:UDP-2-acetamido-2-deoxy-ribo-hexuluronate aminotransferase